MSATRALATILENANVGSLQRLQNTGMVETQALIIPDPKMIRMGAKEP